MNFNTNFGMKDDYNTIAIIGLEATESCFYATFKVYASTEDYNWYEDHIGVDVSENRDVVEIGQQLSHTNTISKKFHPKLYEREPTPLGNFKDQRNVPCVAR